MISLGIKVLIVVLLLLIIPLGKSVYASCAGGIPISEHKDKADVVVIGTVKQSFENYSQLLVEKYFKGQGSNELRVTGLTGGKYVSTSIDLSLIDGKRYLLFLKGKPDEIMKANLCNGSRVLENGLTDEEKRVLSEQLSTTPIPTSSPTVLPKIDNNMLFIIPLVLLTGVVLGIIIKR